VIEQKSAISYFYSFFIFLGLAIIVEYLYAGIFGVIQGNVLSVMELSLSFDNAVVNAIILQTMSIYWRKAFVTWGMLIAVFGMRLVFPVLIVSISTGMSIVDAFNLAVSNPSLYEEYIFLSYAKIMAFGSMFLFMIYLDFLLNEEKDVHWIGWIEESASKWAGIDGIKIFLAILAGLCVMYFLPAQRLVHGHIVILDKFHILVSMIIGLLSYLFVGFIKNFLEDNNQEEEKTDEEVAQELSKNIALKGGIASFLYLEMIDMSLSFDGVLAAFAVSQNIIIIMIGLGVGAMAVRSLTLLMVDKKTIDEFIYLEHGAMWSIGLLSVIMSTQLYIDIPEWIIVTVAILPIAIAFIHSHYSKNIKD